MLSKEHDRLAPARRLCNQVSDDASSMIAQRKGEYLSVKIDDDLVKKEIALL